jgi:GNAT superfamily N-acetyltransferase
MDGTPKIRDISPSDYAQWLPLWRGYNAFYGRSGPTALPAEVTEATWKRFFDASEPVYALVADLDGHLVALAHYIFHRSTTLVAPICYLQDLFTAPDRRRTGVARTLIETVYRRARQLGSARVYWQTHETNAVAQQLYDQVAQRSGFIVYRKTLPDVREG